MNAMSEHFTLALDVTKRTGSQEAKVMKSGDGEK